MIREEFSPSLDVNYTTSCERWHNISLSICSCGYKVLARGGIDYSGNPDFVLCYVSSGEGRYRCGEHEFHVTEGQGYLVAPNMLVTVTAEGETPFRVYWVAFNGFYAERYLLRARLSDKSPVFEYELDNNMAWRFNRLIEHSKYATTATAKCSPTFTTSSPA